MKKYINGFLRLGTAAALLFVIYNQNKQLKELKVENGSIELLTNQCDSLKSEMFSRDVEVGRYELTLEYLKEVNPKAAKEFEDYMSHNTE
jgi:hypothetical protein